MNNILKIIGLSLSAALSCSADKCWHCNVNDATGATSGLCEQCKDQQCTHCGMFDPAAEHTASNGTVCTQCRKAQQDPFGM